MSHANRHPPQATATPTHAAAHAPTTATPSHNDIALAAFLQWQAKGGDAQQNWIQSEQRLSSARSSPTAAPTAKLTPTR
jgi:hypothetical protein